MILRTDANEKVILMTNKCFPKTYSGGMTPSQKVHRYKVFKMFRNHWTFVFSSDDLAAAENSYLSTTASVSGAATETERYKVGVHRIRDCKIEKTPRRLIFEAS